jgi:hypothetical protein
VKVIRLDRSAVYGIVSFVDIFYYTDQLDDDPEETPVSLELLGICNSFCFYLLYQPHGCRPICFKMILSRLKSLHLLLFPLHRVHSCIQP